MTNPPTNQQKWTPGPWAIEENVKAGGIIHLAVTARQHGAEDWMPCSVTPMHKVRTVDYANARLIAAAPEMYDLLDEFLTDLNCVSVPDKAAPRLQCDCWKCVFANRVYALMKRIKGEG